ncbi:MAG: zinc-ribbon domain-containing protein [Clostridia bacterium]|nr:zinc-ribbon domain-containing protein [Clostridia bacterium]
MPYCTICGFQLSEDDRFCPVCGAPKDDKPMQPVSRSKNNNHIHDTLICPKCSGQMVVQAVSEQKKTGCLTTLLYILLACTGIGLLIVIFVLLRKKAKTESYAVCQKCGYMKKLRG